jgi:hypothetical protein
MPCELDALEASEFSLVPSDMNGTSSDIARGARCGELGNPPCEVGFAFCDSDFDFLFCHNFVFFVIKVFFLLGGGYRLQFREFGPKILHLSVGEDGVL